MGKRDQDRIHDSCFPSRKQTLQQENLRRMPGHHSMVSAKLQEGGRGGRWQDRWAGRQRGQVGKDQPPYAPSASLEMESSQPPPRPPPSSCPRMVTHTIKNLPAMWGTWVLSLGQEDSLEKGMATHSSILAWRIPWTEALGGLQSVGSQRVEHD